MRALIVEDELKMASLIRRGLLEEGYAADVTATGEDAVWMAGATEYDAIILDVMLPGMDGFAVCRRLREHGVWSPVLMLTARDAVEDRIAGLDTGADDYLTKPFSFAELLARLRALTRRGAVERPSLLELGSLRLDPRSRQAWRGDTEIELFDKGIRAARDAHAPAGAGRLALRPARARLGLQLREPLERHRRLHPLPAGEDRPAVRAAVNRDGSRRGLPPAPGRRGVEPRRSPASRSGCVLRSPSRS